MMVYKLFSMFNRCGSLAVYEDLGIAAHKRSWMIVPEHKVWTLEAMEKLRNECLFLFSDPRDDELHRRAEWAPIAQLYGFPEFGELPTPVTVLILDYHTPAFVPLSCELLYQIFMSRCKPRAKREDEMDRTRKRRQASIIACLQEVLEGPANKCKSKSSR
jgi:hypothetical protein